MEKSQKVQFMCDALAAVTELFIWKYGPDGRIIHSNCPNEYVLDMALGYHDCKQRMLEHGGSYSQPLMLTSALGLAWVAVYEKTEREVTAIYLLGPVFGADISFNTIYKAANRLDIPMALQGELFEEIRKLPTIGYNVLSNYGLMLHYSLTGQKLGLSEVMNQPDADPYQVEATGSREGSDRHRTWMIEQAILRNVREGDMNYQAAMDMGSMVSTGVRIKIGDPLRHAKDSTIVFISLCVRAAIEGGLVPDISYAVGDGYIQAVELAQSIGDVTGVSHKMYEDFIQRVHKSRENPAYSEVIKECCEYIAMNVDNKLETEALAKRAGYTPYYLTRKFKQEVGVSLNSYINYSKAERAKVLLATTDMSIQEIAARLNFANRSHFSRIFQETVGIAPGVFREKGVKP